MKKSMVRKEDGTFDGVPCSPGQRRLLAAYVAQGQLPANTLDGVVSKNAAAALIRKRRLSALADSIGSLSEL